MQGFPAVKILFITLLFLLPLTARTVRDVPYIDGGTAEQRLDIHLPKHPAGTLHPVIVAIHGGGWSAGSRSASGFLQPKTRWLNGLGYIVVSIDYRLSPAVHHPAHIDDVCAAITWVEKHIAEHHGDPREIYLLGHSAGAQLAALAATDTSRLRKAGGDPRAIQGVILLDGVGYDIPTELTRPRMQELLRQAILSAFTSDPATQRNASPVYHVHRGVAPFLLLHPGDSTPPHHPALLMAEALRRQGGYARVVAIPNKDHTSLSHDLGRRGDPTTKAVEAFLGLDP
ncbi:acetyl esterase/lipase [Haloferula luteola]|uniref:Acetyl esterase/lipase n=1 Tax=Haloferula luteola TaxID=595692 RepID=A0A840VD64_9BACT|nr:alpha/beta hydrolase [Haloferula luteola]MBB5352568.1 acetyl esterase/lipase [Haloferula luteola]